MKKEKILTYKYYIILVLLLLSLFVALNYCKKFKIGQKAKAVVADISKKNSSPVAKEEDKVASSSEGMEIETDSKLATSLHNMINVFDTDKAGSYYGYFYSQDYIDYNTMSDDVKVMIGLTQTKYFNNDFVDATYEASTPEGSTFDMIIISKEEIQEGINNFFGPHTQFFDTDLADAETDYCGFSRFKFDNTRNVYMSFPVTCSGFPRPYIDSKITKVYEYGNTIELTIKIAYIKYETSSNENITKYVYRNLNDHYIEKHDLLTDNTYNINKILNKLDSYKFTFTLNSDNYYYFTKVEKVK